MPLSILLRNGQSIKSYHLQHYMNNVYFAAAI